MTQTAATDEGGFSLIELIVVTGLLALVLTTLFGALATFSARTNQTQERALMLSEARSSVEIVMRDLRAANPVNPVSPASTYDSSVSFSVYCANAGVATCGSDHLRPVIYTVTSGHQLQQTMGPAGSTVTKVILGPRGSTGAVTSRQGAIVNSSSQPVFRYFKKDGTLIPTDGTKPSETFRDCAQYVEIHLVVVAERGRPTSTLNLVTRADVRNFNEVSGCS
jgi:type II secretory pathway pseudopilin PulG